MKKGNIALFIPHAGCPHQCSFCNQKQITGVQREISAQDVCRAVETALAKGRPEGWEYEIAFFGGSFTAVPETYQRELLEAASRYVRDGKVRGIRVSTRPDAVSPGTLEFLKRYGVTAVELGAQSMDDQVLARSGRGHTAGQVRQAAGFIREAGISLGLQMMVGLPGDTATGALYTARELAALRPDTVRIYPTVVLRGSALETQFLQGEYTPISLESAVELCADLLDCFDGKGIPVIRLGLHASPELEQGYVCGPWHPAFRELCESLRMRRRIFARLPKPGTRGCAVRVTVHPRWVSRAVGQKRANLQAFAAQGFSVTVRGDEKIAPGEVDVEC